MSWIQGNVEVATPSSFFLQVLCCYPTPRSASVMEDAALVRTVTEKLTYLASIKQHGGLSDEEWVSTCLLQQAWPGADWADWV